MNPELRQTLHNLSRNIESANETAQENIYTFSHNYIDPCFSSIKACFESCTAPCCSTGDARKRRRSRRGSRARAELNFDFYDDWYDEFGDEPRGEESSLLGWGNERLDRLLAGSQHSHQDGRGARGADSKQPRRQRAMSYGARGRRPGLPDDGVDPTVIPSSSYIGFLERLPWGIGRRGLRYKPSAADLQEHPGGNWTSHSEAAPLVEDSDEDEHPVESSNRPQGRKRSETNASQSTNNSLSSRGDLIPSDEEIESDAVPLDDEFAVGLERRNTGPSADDWSSTKIQIGKRPSYSRTSTRSVSGKSTRSITNRSQRSVSGRADIEPEAREDDDLNIPSLGDLKQEEELAREEEEADIERKREAARALAQDRGLIPDFKEDQDDIDSEETFVNPEMVEETSIPPPTLSTTEHDHVKPSADEEPPTTTHMVDDSDSDPDT